VSPALRKWILAASTLLIVSLVVALVLPWWRANARISDPQWVEHAAPREVAREAENVLRYPVGNHHDACLLLIQTGDSLSVPVLRQSLARFDESECTADHCREALRALTPDNSMNQQD